MKEKAKKLLSIMLTAVFLVLYTPWGALNTSAATSGHYTYTISNGEAIITDVSTTIAGEVTVPSTLGGYPVTAIGNFAFQRCKDITRLTLPEGLTSIGINGISYCNKVTQIHLPSSLVTIDDNAFSKCTSLKQINIPQSVVQIGEGAFYDCKSLEEIIIPKGIESINASTFCHCENLSKVVIPESVTYIGYRAFSYCNSLKRISIPNSVVEIGKAAFASCEYLFGITIPEGVKTIENDTFTCCHSLNQVALPDTIETIGDDAFFNTQIEEINLPASLTKIGKDAFAETMGQFHTVWYGGTAKEKNNIVIKTGNEGLKNATWHCESSDVLTSGKYFYRLTSKGSVIVDTNDSLNGEVAIPNKLGGKPVIIIGRNAFLQNTKITNVTLPESITKIDVHAFAGCDGLTSIAIPDKVTHISMYAFGGCDKLYSVTIGKKVKTIDFGAFEGCKTLSSLVIPKSVKTIGNNAFLDCDELWKVKYTGSKTDKKSIKIGYNNTCLTRGTWYYNCKFATITTQPQTAYAAKGEIVKTTIKATGDGLKYVWYVKNAGSSKYIKSRSTSATYSAIMSNKSKDRRVLCKVYDKYGNMVQSKSVLLREAVSITAQPKSTTVAKNKTAKVTVKASGDGLTYVWYVKDRNASKYIKSSITSATYSVKMNATRNGRKLICYVYDKYGNWVQCKTVVIKMK